MAAPLSSIQLPFFFFSIVFPTTTPSPQAIHYGRPSQPPANLSAKYPVPRTLYASPVSVPAAYWSAHCCPVQLVPVTRPSRHTQAYSCLKHQPLLFLLSFVSRPFLPNTISSFSSTSSHDVLVPITRLLPHHARATDDTKFSGSTPRIAPRAKKPPPTANCPVSKSRASRKIGAIVRSCSSASQRHSTISLATPSRLQPPTLPAALRVVPPTPGTAHDPRLRLAQYPATTAKLASPTLLHPTVSYDARTNPPRSGSTYLDMDDKAPGRRRRSSSILQVYHEPRETLEQISDQAALPNLNANWTNAKGTPILSPSKPFVLCRQGPILTCPYRSVDYSFRFNSMPQNLLRRHSRCLAGDIVDPDQHNLHGRLLHHVPLCPRSPIRIQ